MITKIRNICDSMFVCLLKTKLGVLKLHAHIFQLTERICNVLPPILKKSLHERRTLVFQYASCHGCFRV